MAAELLFSFLPSEREQRPGGGELSKIQWRRHQITNPQSQRRFTGGSHLRPSLVFIYNEEEGELRPEAQHVLNTSLPLP